MASIDQQCDAKPLDWALFTTTIIGQYVTWWLIPIPVIFKHGFRHYIHDVAWECMRLQQPSYIVFRSCFQQERVHWQSAYYSGILKPPTRLENIKALAQDSFILVSTTLALYRLHNGSETDKDLTSGLNSSLWVYPSLPVAIFGLSVVIFSRTKVKLWLIFVITILFTLCIIAMVSVTIALTFKRQGHNDLWEFSTFPILYETIPLWALSYNLIFFTGLLSVMTRFGPIIGSVTHRGYFPFCQLRGWGFGGTLTGLAIINMILALYAISLTPRRERPAEIEEMKEIP